MRILEKKLNKVLENTTIHSEKRDPFRFEQVYFLVSYGVTTGCFKPIGHSVLLLWIQTKLS